VDLALLCVSEEAFLPTLGRTGLTGPPCNVAGGHLGRVGGDLGLG
jgi:hypothetical protein